VRLSPGNAIYHYNLANACEDLADVECAISEYQAAIERRSDLAIAYNNLGRLLIRQERWEEADGLLLAALANPVPPWLEVALRKNLGWALAEQKIYGQAIEQLTWARDMQEAIQPPDAEAYARLAEIYRLMALSYGALEQTVEAQRAWRNCLGLATLIDTVEGQKWEMEAREHLRTLDEGR
jgi:Tfp pilus assembly protein PilF